MDGYVVVYDASITSNRYSTKQADFLSAVCVTLSKQKRAYVIATTKNDIVHTNTNTSSTHAQGGTSSSSATSSSSNAGSATNAIKALENMLASKEFKPFASSLVRCVLHYVFIISY